MAVPGGLQGQLTWSNKLGTKPCRQYSQMGNAEESLKILQPIPYSVFPKVDTFNPMNKSSHNHPLLARSSPIFKLLFSTITSDCYIFKIHRFAFWSLRLSIQTIPHPIWHWNISITTCILPVSRTLFLQHSSLIISLEFDGVMWYHRSSQDHHVIVLILHLV